MQKRCSVTTHHAFRSSSSLLKHVSSRFDTYHLTFGDKSVRVSMSRHLETVTENNES